MLTPRERLNFVVVTQAKSTRCTVLMTSNITWSPTTVYLKIKVCMEWVSKFEALHTPTTPLHCTPTTPLHCTPTTPLHCIHNNATPLLHCISLHHTFTTPLHYIATTPLQFAALYSLHCMTTTYSTVLGTLHYHYCTARHCTATPLLHWISLHCIHYTTRTPLLHCTSLHCAQ